MILSLANSKSSESASSLLYRKDADVKNLRWSCCEINLLIFVHSLCNGRVHEVFDLRTCKAWGHLRQNFSDNIFAFLDFVQVEIKDVLPSIDVWVGHMDFFVETTRSYSCWV